MVSNDVCAKKLAASPGNIHADLRRYKIEIQQKVLQSILYAMRTSLTISRCFSFAQALLKSRTNQNVTRMVKDGED